MNASKIFRGCMPALMTPCDERGEPDFGNLVATAKNLMDQGMSGVIYCGSMGEWPLLSDEQRKEGVERLVEAGVPVIVGTGAPNTSIAVSLATHAQSVKAAGLMLIPRVLSRTSSPDAQSTHFSRILSATPQLPAVIYNSPHYGFETRAELFFRLRSEHKNLVGFKEFGGSESLTYAVENITGGDSSLSLMVGVDTQVFHGIVHCGATGAITGVGNALPSEVLRLVALCQDAAAGDDNARTLALELESALAELSEYDEGPDLVLFYKRLMTLEGHQGYEHAVDPTDRLTVTQQEQINSQWQHFRDWWQTWRGADKPLGKRDGQDSVHRLTYGG